MKYLVSAEELPLFNVSRPGILAAIFNGADHGLPGISVILNETLPGDGAPLHRHAYDELFLVQEGHCSFIVAEQTVEAGAGQLVLIPSGAPHGFTNTGETNMRLVAIHAAPRVEIEWLDAGVPV
jgi:mannose-6-phosphate isomerase-like protein (cupin superfamily)